MGEGKLCHYSDDLLYFSDSRSSLLLTGDTVRNSLGYCLPTPLRLKMVRDCCAGVAFLHSRGLMHCDIKSLNFLVTKDFVVKLSDLGEARPYRAIHVDRVKLPKYHFFSILSQMSFLEILIGVLQKY